MPHLQIANIIKALNERECLSQTYCFKWKRMPVKNITAVLNKGKCVSQK